MTDIRRLVVNRETVRARFGPAPARPVVRAVGLAVIANPCAGRYVEDLGILFEAGRAVGERLMPDLVAQLGGAAVSYGKGALVGLDGEMEHGGACIHPMLGRPMRAAIGGGQAIIPSNVKLAPAGAALDVPLGHKDNVWSFDHFDTMTVSLPDAPLPDEIVIVIAIADGGRVNPRCGQGPVR
ncbi:MAG: amino acid synthesis family protein [Alphaproteobacteria bacterium]|nr:amino acid synthesis family protein [Alphaproteobacteria bacterium]